jgi:hypothetical protein
LIFAATALQAQPSPSSMPTPHLSKELQEVFDREEKLTPIMHQHALAILDQLAGDLHRLRDRLEPELVNQELSDGINPNSAPSSGGCTEPATPLYRTRFSTKAGLDSWYKIQTDRLSVRRKDLDDGYSLWLKLRQQDQKNILDDEEHYPGDPRTPGWIATALRNLLKNETSYYSYQYQFTALALYGLWVAELDEHRGWRAWDKSGGTEEGSIVGLATLMDDEAKRQMDAYHNTLWNCQSVDAQKWAAAHQECMVVRERLRSEFATRFRDLRDRLIAEGIEVRTRLTQWRAFCIANHYYVGEGPEAISAVYVDAVPRSFKAMSTWAGRLDYRSYSELPYGIVTRIDAGSCGSFNNDDPDSARVIRYPDVETAPYDFGIVFDAPTVIERIVSGAAESEGP